MAPRVEPVDFWQAHSDGGLLELMGTRDTEAATGFSDDDPEGIVDPGNLIQTQIAAHAKKLVYFESRHRGARPAG